jgi:hypothetical protein
MSAIAYGFCGVVALAIAGYRAARESPILIRRIRRALCGILVIGAVLIPLASEIHWRAQATPGAHAQPEVAVIERAGDRVAENKSPYPLHPISVGIPPTSQARDTNQTAYFPYLPGMIPFGLMNALHLPTELTDARVALVSFTLLIAALALAVSGSAPSKRARVVQILIALPTGALPLATGGDDLPVLVLLFLGLVIAARRRPALAGLVLGLAGTLKFTAWPVILLMLFAARDTQGRPAPKRYALSAGIVLAPALLYGFFSAPGAFMENAIRFPLGLTELRSPAASPLLGHALSTLFPNNRHLVTAVLGVVGVALLLVYLSRHLPRTVANVSRTTALALFAATVLAPTTRFGYLIYPANLILWSFFLKPLETEAEARDYAASPRSRIRTSTELDPRADPPPSAGVTIAGLSSTNTPTAQV